MRWIFLMLVTSILAASNLNAQTTYSHAGLGGTSLPDYTISAINTSNQQLSIQKRYFKMKLDMGDIYELGSNSWSVSLTMKVKAMDGTTLLKEFDVTLATDQSQPEKMFTIDYTALGNQVDHFEMSNLTYTNSQVYSQNYVRLTLSNEDVLGYGTLDNQGFEIRPDVVSVDPVQSGISELVQVTFNWALPQANQHFDSYDLEVLKVEPDINDQVVMDWSKANTIEVEGGATSYTMTMAEGTGFYFWRVRGIGSYYPGGRTDQRNYGRWSTGDFDNVTGYSTMLLPLVQNGASGIQLYDFSGSQPQVHSTQSSMFINPVTGNGPVTQNNTTNYFYYTQFNNDINWSYGRVFAEDSKLSETMTFANGLNQVQQVQTKLFSRSQVIGTQTVYDFSARPALQSLPAPVNDTKLGYKSSFFLNSSSTLFTAGDFDADATLYIPATLAPSTNAGSPNHYFSGNNTFGPKAAYVPDAKGYPYSRTLFYSDATGRVFKAGGAGDVMRLKDDGTEKNPVVLYGSVAEVELDRVFGSEAPDTGSVYKVVNIDPNGVTSVSYIAQAGQTLATCLDNSGTVTAMEDVGSEGAGFSVTDVFAPGVVVPGNDYSTVSKTLIVAGSSSTPTVGGLAAKDIGVDYTITPEKFGISCENICWTCDYKVEISITCPQDPIHTEKNVKVIFDITPQDLAAAGTCNTFTPSAITLASVGASPATYNLVVYDASGTAGAAPSGLSSITANPGTVRLPSGTYLIEKKVYVNNIDPATTNINNLTYLQQRITDLQNEASSWTASSNCCGPITIPDGFDCTPASPDCSDDTYMQTLFDFVEQERTGLTSTGGTYSSLLTGGQSGLLSTSIPCTTLTQFKDHVNNVLIPAGYSCEDIQECMMTVGNYLNMNFAAATYSAAPGNPNPAPDFNEDFDLMEMFYSCLGYDPTSPCTSLTDVKLYDPTATFSSSDVVIWYVGLSGLTSAPAVSGYLVEIINPNGTTTPSGTVANVTKNSNCYSQYGLPSPLAPAGTLAEQQEWSAKAICECTRTSNTPPTGFTEPTTTDIENTCIDVCEGKRLSFEQSIESFINNYNYSAGLTSPSDAGWKTFADLFPGVDKSCLVNTIVQRCKTQCNMTESFNLIDNYATLDLNPNSTTTYTSPYTSVVYANYHTYINSSEFQALVQAEQLAYEQAMTWTMQVAPVDLTAPQYSNVGPPAQVREEILDFIEQSLSRAVMLKGITGDLLNSPPATYAASLQSPAFSGSANYKYHQETKDFVLQVTQGANTYNEKGTVVTNVIWDSSNDNLLEINVAFYCTGANPATAFAKWSYAPTYSCDYFDNFGINVAYILDDIATFRFDGAGVFHAVLGASACAGTEVKSTNVSNVSHNGVFSFDVSSGSSGDNIFMEVQSTTDAVALFNSAVNWNASGAAATATDIVTAINSITTTPDYTATSSGATVTIYVPGYYSGDPTDLTLSIQGSVTTANVISTGQLTGASFGDELVTAACSTLTETITAECPYGYTRIYGTDYSYADNSTDNAQMFANLNSFWTDAIEQGILNRQLTIPAQNVAYPVAGYSTSSYSYYQETTSFIFSSTKFDAIATVIRNSTGKMMLAEISLHACDGAVFSITLTDQDGGNIFDEYDVPNAVPTQGTFMSDLFTLAFDAGTGYNVMTISGNTASNAKLSVTAVNAGWQQSGTPRTNTGTATIDAMRGQCSDASECSICIMWDKIDPYVPELTLDPMDCADQEAAFVESQTAFLLNQCYNEQAAALQADYYDNCLGSIADQFTISYELGYYHYTLYYYDRSGNLTKTVPPEGVHFITSTTTPSLQDVIDYRTGTSATPAIPAHGTINDLGQAAAQNNLTTRYEFNSIKQLIEQQTPDGGVSQFWYNAAGQLILSQDAAQAATGTFSYSRYDALGRVVEVGELVGYTPAYQSGSLDQINTDLWTSLYFPYTSSALSAVIGSATVQEVTRTQYTNPEPGLLLNGQEQQHLRNRVSKVWTDDGFATYYSYDPHGNVEWMVHELQGIGRKTVRYEYDMVSNKVNKVYYQEDTPEQFIHRYEYDSDNRITHVYTSTDGTTWDREGEYEYYMHGPLSREEIGEDKVQGIDYVYTIEGYLKSINQVELDVTKDPGLDQSSASYNTLKDEFAMELGYYQNDYDRTGSNIGAANSTYDPYAAGGPMTAATHSLYNGNISYWMNNTRDGNTAHASNALAMRMNVYRYDKLNRIRSADFKQYSGGSWNDKSNSASVDPSSAAVGSGAYDELFTYDGNGNIKTLKRNGYTGTGAGISMDDFTYEYHKDATTLKLLQNRLYHVDDAVVGSPYTDDIEDQGTFTSGATVNTANNYSYDEEGNLIKDVTENILDIEWNLQNKVASVKKQDVGVSPTEYYYLLFEYDAMGNRVLKRETERTTNSSATAASLNKIKSTYYVLDASGNVMAIYTRTYDAGTSITAFKLEEMPIYGSSRIGQYKPGLTVASFSYYVDEAMGMIQPSTSSEMSKWLAASGNGVQLVNMDLSANAQVTTAVNTAQASNNAVSILDDNGNVILGAYMNSAGGNWNLVNGSYASITPAGTMTGDAGVNANAVILPKPGSANYYFIYPNSGSAGALRAIGSAEVNLSANSAATPISLGNGTFFGTKVTAATYADGSSRLFLYGKNSSGTQYEIYTIDVSSAITGDFGTPQLRAAVNNSNGNAIREDNELAISPNGDYLAMTLYQGTANATFAKDVVVWEMDPSTATLTNPVYYNTSNGLARHLEFSHSGRYLLYSTSSGSVRRISLVTGADEAVTYTASADVDICRSVGSKVILAQAGATGLDMLNYVEDADYQAMTVSSNAIPYPSTTTQLDLPNQNIVLNVPISVLGSTVYSELNNWTTATRATSSLSGLVDVDFTSGSPVAANTLPFNLSAYHNEVVAEDANGDVAFKFFVTQENVFFNSPLPILVDKTGWPLSGTWFTIYADPATKSMAVKAPGNNDLYYLITGKQGQLYYHVIDMGIGNGQVISINNPITDASLNNITYHSTMKQYALAAYNDVRTSSTSRLYMAVNKGSSIVVYESAITPNGIDPAVSVRTYTDKKCIQFFSFTACQINTNPQLDLGEMQLSPNGNQLAVKVTSGKFNTFNQLSHKLELFTVDITQPQSLTYSTSKELVAENRPSSAGNLPLRNKLKKNSISIDYTGSGNYIYYVEQKTPINYLWFYKQSSLKRVELSNAAITTVANYTDVKYESEVRRGVDDKMYVNQLPQTVQCFSCTPTFVSRLLQYSTPEGTPAQATINLNSGNNNYGITLQPYKVVSYNEEQLLVDYSVRTISKKVYELKDHLSNVRAVISDLRGWTDGDADNTVDYTEGSVTVRAWMDYYAFGSEMPGRAYTSNDYRYGFNGMEKDDEVKGSGNSYDFGARIYDSRLGRFLSIDPKYRKFPDISPYCFAANSPLAFVDENGEGPVYVVLSVDQSTRIKAAIKKGDYKTVNKILKYGTTHVFVDANQQESTWAQRVLKKSDIHVQPNNIPIIRGKDTPTNVTWVYGVESDGKGGYKIAYLGHFVPPPTLDEQIAETKQLLSEQKKELKKVLDLEFANDKQKSDNPADPSAGGEGINLGKGLRAAQIQAQKEKLTKEIKETEQKLDGLQKAKIIEEKVESSSKEETN